MQREVFYLITPSGKEHKMTKASVFSCSALPKTTSVTSQKQPLLSPSLKYRYIHSGTSNKFPLPPTSNIAKLCAIESIFMSQTLTARILPS